MELAGIQESDDDYAYTAQINYKNTDKNIIEKIAQRADKYDMEFADTQNGADIYGADSNGPVKKFADQINKDFSKYGVTVKVFKGWPK